MPFVVQQKPTQNITKQLHCCCCVVTRSCPTLLWPHRLQAIRVLCSWALAGKNTGVGCCFLLQRISLTQGSKLCLLHCMQILCLSAKKRIKSESRSVMSDSLKPHGLYSPWNSAGKNTGVGCCFLLQGIFLTQESNPGLLHCRQILYWLSYKGSLSLRELTPILKEVLLWVKCCQIALHATEKLFMKVRANQYLRLHHCLKKLPHPPQPFSIHHLTSHCPATSRQDPPPVKRLRLSEGSDDDGCFIFLAINNLLY